MLDIHSEVENALILGNQILHECLNSYCEPFIYKIEFKEKSKSYWAKIGRDSKKNSGYFLRIGGLFSLIPDENVAKIRFQSTIIHELIHTIPGCMNHGKRFKRICYLVNKKYPQYKLQTSTGVEDLGIQLEEPIPKYKIICKCCGKEYLYQRKPKLAIDMYKCSKCGKSDLELVNIN